MRMREKTARSKWQEGALVEVDSKVRLGVIVPSGNTLLEPELTALGLPGVTFHFSRICNYRDTEEELSAMLDEAPYAAELLSHAGVSAVLFGCTGGSFLKGGDYDTEVKARIQQRVAVPVTTTSSAVVAALRGLGVRRVTLLTPYEEWLTERGAAFLRDHDFEVLSHSFLGITDPLAMVEMPGAAIAEWALPRVEAGSQAVFISCTCFRGMEAVPQLEAALGIPVITSNQASVWQLLSMVGREPRVPGLGRLLSSPVPGSKEGFGG